MFLRELFSIVLVLLISHVGSFINDQGSAWRKNKEKKIEDFLELSLAMGAL
jgi:hypothetical protein